MRKILTILFISIALFSCKPTQLSFSPAQMNITHVKNMFATDKNYDTSKIKSGKIYVANLSENYIYRDGLAEKTIMNDSSTKQKLEIPLLDKKFKLFVIKTKIDTINAAIFLPAILDGANRCIGMGPALIGKYDYGELVFYKRIKFYSKKKGRKNEWVLDKKSTYYPNRSLYSPFDLSKTKLNIRFITSEIDPIPELSAFTVTQIYQLSDNRFGGKKPLIFNIGTIFEDPDALRFSYFTKF
ncbi:MAG: hypothetical protein IPK31_11960 [Chitinophagaceae bacterium]|nr:hypothetical protein [Chitinophagaceae bacterium]